MIGKKSRRNNIWTIIKNYWKWTLLIFSLLIVSLIFIVILRPGKPKFEGKRAYNELVKQVSFGPRICGTTGHDKTKEYLFSCLKQYADLVSEQTFNFTDKHDSTIIYKGVNIVASFNLSEEVTKRILLCAHWDSRPFADNDPVFTNHKLPVPAANDGASGVAVLLEMARLFAESKPNVGIDIVLFDLEDIGEEADSTKKNTIRNPFCIGSEKFVEQNPNYYPEYGILLDMVGDKDLRIPKEAFSAARAYNVVEKIWTAASTVGSNVFVNENGGAVIDDHIVFLKKSIPVVDLIHLPFPKTWHTVNDIPEHCSSESLQKVGNVLVEVIYNEK
jgi:hypothetical protein